MSERPTYTLKGDTGDWELVMGLEVHAQVASQAKLFSGASTEFGADPNCNVSLVDAAMPGMLPVINRKCVEQAVRTGLGLKAKINKYSRFDRKNYFYPDLPQGYQISQFDHPIVGEGEIEVDVEPAHGDPAYSFPVRIERLHLEQDAGKSIHDMDPTATYVDLNRSGVALMEIVSKPDVRTPLEAAAYVKKLKSIVVALGTCDGDMEKGNLRADVNVSVCKPGAYEKFRETGDFSHLGTRCEIKNMNSFRFIQAAIEYEARRQIEIIESGGKVDQETRLFDPNKGETRSMRSKEDAHDYRYFPDPDLLPLEIDDLFIDNIRESLPELPDEKRQRFESEYGLSRYDAGVLTADSERAEFFEAVAKGRDAKLAANWVSQELFGYLNREDLELADSPVSAKQLGELVDLISNDTISGKIAKDVFARMIDGEGDPGDIVEKHGLKQVTDTGAIEAIVDEIIAANPEQAESVKEKPKAMGWFVGQVMKASGGKANPQAVNEILKQKLGL
ncbi:MAG: Asp-tRNA(Asn)/Glu-tRNA(Gln) amidotransferase GatCAB subunit B [Henriciella sp.]|uniref:Asp-tRNA(Asn)/Glu-tRNA(Gln) amidotransferase subunit GatB n=1 Tax=Henriciella sp. TaxID=1968823 RepID=UPI000C0FB377|nr:Asp-tRNA(Asn)/Glu-tRNA(Gln) amidotransferase subunit GatB [Henriciella sp.]MAN73117.1 Asp-tRNA(Asn)/Glu-tRNA(Gln) amidotransferase GatCAB subunit B [Henriciella sp.]MBF35390.1 Asp-tRNA(Asn)/Glu-tRNA(Gln) amidotransferase GatCAB subunit B [Hyphomonadaceae bacterium]PHR79314.1 MAG: Asp-tRNA(Asn)/Glu-tRNA(Gln) amidotransferase GatCAB subunit B [Henriciella sp.]|tara:strand:+ start:16976 stop:18487 length:1512 start_codon:yes stop_codon:yes gene_type:complete